MERYLLEPYQKEAQITVPALVKSGGWYHFFQGDMIVVPPMEGRTDGDVARINGAPLEVLQDEQGQVVYRAQDLTEGAEATVSIDWTVRLTMMQRYLGSVLLEIALEELLATQVLEVNTQGDGELGPYVAIEGEDLGFKALEQLEEYVNRMIAASFPIESYGERFAIEGFATRKALLPVLSSTGECALFAISQVEKRGEAVRIYYVVGQEALHHYRALRTLVKNLSFSYGTSNPEKLFQLIKKQQSRWEDKKVEEKKVQATVNEREVEALYREGRSLGKLHVIYRNLHNFDFQNTPAIISALQKKPHTLQIYGIPNGSMAQVMVLRSADIPVDLKALLDELSARFNIKGSGNLYRVSGNLPIVEMEAVKEQFLMGVQQALRHQE
ncbi:MAG: hypothetical protein Q4E76_06255 [Tissierellia bacterium]|nr:hypothetical protein [Tissierellia bacterium]